MTSGHQYDAECAAVSSDHGWDDVIGGGWLSVGSPYPIARRLVDCVASGGGSG